MSREPEALAVAARYARRTDSGRYSMLRPEVWQTVHERQRAMLGLFTQAGLQDLSRLRLLEVGCGAGGNLLELLRLGFAPQHLGGIELLSERLALARAVLPDALRLQGGDALQADVAAGSLDIVYLATVLSSLLDDAYQQRLADAMWSWLVPGGAVLCYDFTLNNPRNPDVRGVPLARLRALFPQGHQQHLGHGGEQCGRHFAVELGMRRAGRGNALPWLRTHVLAWIAKP